MAKYKAPKEDARYGAENSPQSRKEDVGFEVPVAAQSLQDEKDLKGWHPRDCVDRTADMYPAPREEAGWTAGTRGAADEAPAGD